MLIIASRYGKYTVTLGIACLMLVIATGRTIEADLLPFFAMLAAFLTLAWPYLGESLYRFRRHWYTPLSVDDLESGPLPSGYVPLGHIYVDSLEEDHRNGHGPWASRQAGPRDQSQGLPQAGLVGTDTTNSPRASIIASFSINARNQSHSPSGRSELLLHIGGAATGSGRSTPPSEQSISLSAVTGRVPSDISSNVLQLLVGHTGQDEGGTNESKTVSQRRADILDLPLKRSGQPQEGDAQSSLLANAGAFDEPQASKRPPQVSDEPQASKRPKVSSELQASDEHQAPETPPASNAPP